MYALIRIRSYPLTQAFFCRIIAVAICPLDILTSDLAYLPALFLFFIKCLLGICPDICITTMSFFIFTLLCFFFLADQKHGNTGAADDQITQNTDNIRHFPKEDDAKQGSKDDLRIIIDG